MSDSVRPQRRHPIRLPRPGYSPGKNTGVGCHFLLQCRKVEVAQLCPTLSDPTDCSLPGSSVHGIFQARVLEWGAIAFSNREVQTDANQGREGPETREEQREKQQCSLGAGADPPQGIHSTGSLSCFADTESPTRWEKLTVHRPQARGAQTC